MKRLEIKNNVSPNFIGNWDLENKELCKEIIDFFENNSDLHTKGTTGGGVDENIKKSTDITIKPENLKDEKYKVFNKYFPRWSFWAPPCGKNRYGTHSSNICLDDLFK